MVLINPVALLSALAASLVFALPEETFEKRARCNRDNCLRAVVGSRISTGAARGAADCSSFQYRTYSPCATTITFTYTDQVFGGFVTSTETITATGSTNTVTVTAGPLSSAAAFEARDVRRDPEAQPDAKPAAKAEPLAAYQWQKRQAAACNTVISPTSLPSYASTACANDQSRFASACSCNGVMESTVTLSMSTGFAVRHTTITLIETSTITTTVAGATVTTTVN